jgi:hypothetical protein
MRAGIDPGLSCRAEKSSPHPDGRDFPPWQVREAALITLLAPPAASLVLLAIYYVEYRPTVPFSPPDFLAAFVLLAMPIGYMFGAAPALLGASLYCALLTLHPQLFAGRSWLRACVGAVCGGLASWLWFLEWLGVAWNIYGSVGALVMAVVSLRSRISRAVARGPATPGAKVCATEEKHAAFQAK